MCLLKAEHITKTFHGFKALDDMNILQKNIVEEL